MKLTYQIKGMHCKACVEKIKNALSPHFELIDVTLNPPALQIDVDHQPTLRELNKFIAAAGNYTVEFLDQSSEKNKINFLSAYYPIFLIASYILGVAFINSWYASAIHWQNVMNQFMAGFFLVFSAFKFLDLRGFSDGYASYDLLAKRWRFYGYIYPFLELSLGILYLTQWIPTITQVMTIIIMGFSSLGVTTSLVKKQKFQCACLGTILKVPLSSVTLIEDLLMVVLAAVGLIYY